MDYLKFVLVSTQSNIGCPKMNDIFELNNKFSRLFYLYTFLTADKTTNVAATLFDIDYFKFVLVSAQSIIGCPKINDILEINNKFLRLFYYLNYLSMSR